jgi:DNA (cytosine-5)-methyltransferase 1
VNRRPRCLDFFCGAGGASVGYDRAGFDVYGSDLFPMPNYPYPFVQDDAIALFADLLRGYPVRFSNGERLLLSDFDFIAGSPPCQAFSTKTRDKSKHLNLIDPFRDLLEQWDGDWVIENVPTAPLRDPRAPLRVVVRPRRPAASPLRVERGSRRPAV